MLDREVFLPAGSAQDISGPIQRVILRKSTGRVLIASNENEEVTASQGDNISLENAAKTVTVKNLEPYDQEIVVALASVARGNVESNSGAVEVVNTEEINAAAAGCVIHNFTVDNSPVKILSELVQNRRVALIQTTGPITISTEANGVGFAVDGVLSHDAKGELWAVAAGPVDVQIIEYLN